MAALDFDNTEIAFGGKDDFALRKAHLLFKTFGNRLLMETGPRLLTLAFKARLPVSPIVKATVFDQFCGGETIEDCQTTISALAARGVQSILDYSVEGMVSERDFDRNRDEIARTIAFAKDDKNIPFSVFKMTGVARFSLLAKVTAGTALRDTEKAEWQRVRDRVESLCAAAKEAGIMIMIDAEETWIQKAIDDLAVAMMAKFNRERPVVFNTLQMYRTDRLSYLGQAIETARAEGYQAGYKLVRGAYMEKERERAHDRGYPSPIHPSKQATDQAFDDALSLCMANIDIVALCSGSHNEQSAYHLTDLMQKGRLAPSDQRVYFSQLYGMSDHITFNLAHGGYNVAKYVPYGPVRYVMPYLMRRAEENTSVKGQAGRELQLIEREIKRRGESR